MSYDVHLEIDTGGEEPARLGDLDANYTSNMRYAIAHGGISMLAPLSGDPDGFVLDGARASEAAEALARCIAIIERDAEALREDEPANGWGSVDRLLSVFLRPILAACREHPGATVRVCG